MLCKFAIFIGYFLNFVMPVCPTVSASGEITRGYTTRDPSCCRALPVVGTRGKIIFFIKIIRTWG